MFCKFKWKLWEYYGKSKSCNNDLTEFINYYLLKFEEGNIMKDYLESNKSFSETVAITFDETFAMPSLFTIVSPFFFANKSIAN